MKLPITLIKGDKIAEGTETDYRDALPVNMYAVEKEILGAKGYMLSYPGLTELNGAYGIDRGANYNERFENQYRVSGTKFLSFSEENLLLVLGVIPGTKQVRMQDFYSFNTQGILASGRFFLYDPDNGFREVIDTDLGDPIDGVWVDGYYFMTDGEYLFHTDLANEESIDPLKFATAEFSPDPSLGIAKTQDNKVLVFGRYTLEYFVNDATEDFAFRRIETRAQKIGIVATHAKCEVGSRFYVTGGRKQESLGVHAISVGSAEKVSTREIDKILATYAEPDLEDMRMETVTLDGTTFVLIHLPNDTLCFNETIAKVFGINAAWSVLTSSYNPTKVYRGINGVFDARTGYWVYGDRYWPSGGPKIGKLDNALSTHYTEPVESILYTPLVKLEGFSIDTIEVETLPGHNVLIAIGEGPK